MWATRSWNLWSFREKRRFCWQKNILWPFSKAVMCCNPKIVRKELSLRYLSRCGVLRAGISGVAGRNKGFAGRKIFFGSLAKLSCALIPKLLERN
jgi:hypothetical protein